MCKICKAHRNITTTKGAAIYSLVNVLWSWFGKWSELWLTHHVGNGSFNEQNSLTNPGSWNQHRWILTWFYYWKFKKFKNLNDFIIENNKTNTSLSGKGQDKSRKWESSSANEDPPKKNPGAWEFQLPVQILPQRGIEFPHSKSSIPSLAAGAKKEELFLLINTCHFTKKMKATEFQCVVHPLLPPSHCLLLLKNDNNGRMHDQEARNSAVLEGMEHKHEEANV